jgi:hypothetical protein
MANWILNDQADPGKANRNSIRDTSKINYSFAKAITKKGPRFQKKPTWAFGFSS